MAILALMLAATALLPLPASAQMHGGMHSHGDHYGGNGMGVMPGLRGLDATPEESAELAVMFANFRSITREVTELPNGIRTVTYSEDPEVMAVIASHVTGMVARLEEGRDPKVFIQSPTLDILFARADTIRSEIETTATGIVLTQTSDDPEVAEALKVHAAEVTDMADRGMHAVHEAMMRRAAAN
jgi:hypothetical protein